MQHARGGSVRPHAEVDPERDYTEVKLVGVGPTQEKALLLFHVCGSLQVGLRMKGARAELLPSEAAVARVACTLAGGASKGAPEVIDEEAGAELPLSAGGGQTEEGFKGGLMLPSDASASFAGARLLTGGREGSSKEAYRSN